MANIYDIRAAIKKASQKKNDPKSGLESLEIAVDGLYQLMDPQTIVLACGAEKSIELDSHSPLKKCIDNIPDEYKDLHDRFAELAHVNLSVAMQYGKVCKEISIVYNLLTES